MSDLRNPKVDNQQERIEQVREIVNHCIHRRAEGKTITDDSLIQAHPELMPELADRLRKVRVVEAAQQQVDSKGGTAHPFHVRCPQCHTSIQISDDSQLSGLLCPSCGGTFSLVDPSKTIPADWLETVGHFRLLDRLGVGAFGTVWSALDTELDRLVAIKIPRAGQMNAETVDNLIREARAVAQLTHPHIVRIHEVGRDGDRVYLVTDCVQGQDLAHWLTDQQMTPREAAQLCAAVADALDHAHRRGVIHRDLKPSNIMIDAEGEPHLTDFGLAKREAAEVTMTVEGKLLGTPAYMSPEQARGTAHDADARTDIYSLGVILFELLTGDRPFRGNTRMLLHQVLVEEAPSPRKLNHRVSRDLDTICLKCLEKDPHNRYRTAEALHDDLKRFLRGEPVQARPVTKAARAWRWCKRNPLPASLAAALVLAFLGGFAGVTSQWIRAASARDAERRSAFNLALNRGLSLCETGKPDQGLLWLARSLELLPDASADSSRTIRVNLALWASNLPSLELILPDQGEVWSAAFSPDGQLVVTGNSTGIAQIRNVEDGRPVGAAMRHSGGITAVAFSSDGTRIVTGSDDKTARIWNAKTGEAVSETVVHETAVVSVAFSPEGGRVLTGSNTTAQVWNAKTGKSIGKPIGVPSADNDFLSPGVAFSPDGSLILTGGSDNTVRLWHRNGSLIGERFKLGAPVRVAAFSPDGSIFAVGGDSELVQIWDTTTQELLQELPGHRGYVRTLDFSPDGTRIIAGGGDTRVRLWDWKSAVLTHQISIHRGDVRATVFSPDGRRVVTGSTDHTARIWNVAGDKFNRKMLERDEGVLHVEFCAKGTVLAAGGPKSIWLWDVATGAIIAEDKVSGQSGHVDYSSIRSTIVANENSMVVVRQFPSLNPIGQPLQHGQWVEAVAFCPDGSLVLTGSFDKTAKIWDADTGELIRTLTHPDRVNALAVSPTDGKTVLTGCVDHKARLWDIESGQQIGDSLLHKSIVLAVAFNHDGTLFATGSSGGFLQLWRTHTRKPLHPPLQHNGHDARLRSIDFSPDGMYMAVGYQDGMVRFWDVASGKPIVLPRRHTQPAYRVQFSPDGTSIVSGSPDGTVRFWGPPPKPVVGQGRQIILWTQVITGLKLDQEGTVHVLDRATWSNRRQQLQTLGGSL